MDRARSRDEKEMASRRGKLLVDWAIGSVPIGIAAALILGLLAFGLARLRLRKNPPASPAGETPS